jgi:hypothetical protein
LFLSASGDLPSRVPEPEIDSLDLALPPPAVCLPKKVCPGVGIPRSESSSVFSPVHDESVLIEGEMAGREMRQDKVEDLVGKRENRRARSRRRSVREVGRGRDNRPGESDREYPCVAWRGSEEGHGSYLGRRGVRDWCISELERFGLEQREARGKRASSLAVGQ